MIPLPLTWCRHSLGHLPVSGSVDFDFSRGVISYIHMDIQIQPGYIRATVLAVVVLAVLISAFYGQRAGREMAKSNLTLKQVAAINAGLAYFYNDQDRFPGAGELADKAVMGPYVSPVPAVPVPSKQCPSVLSYDTFDQRSFTFRYCLPRDFQGHTAGSYILTERDIQLQK